MSFRDYEFVKQVRESNNIKISVKGLIKLLDCDPATCQGLCCREHTGELVSSYHLREIEEKLPSRLRHLVDSYGNIQIEKGNCQLIPHCIENPSIIPVSCRLFPLGFNKAGRLIIKRWSWVKPCPSYNKGRPIYIAMKQCLTEVFGEEIYNKIVKEIEEAKCQSIML